MASKMNFEKQKMKPRKNPAWSKVSIHDILRKECYTGERTFNVKYDDYGPYQAHGYDAANLILLALNQVGTVDASGNLVIDREALIKAVRNTKGYKGLTGTLTCDAIGECGAGAISINKVQNGQWALVKAYAAADLQD